MKKTILALCCIVATIVPSGAKTVTFKSELSSYQPEDPAEEVVTIPVTWTGRTLYCDAINLFIGGGSKYSAQGGLYVANTGTEKKNVAKSTGNLYLSFVPAGGVTVKKVTVRRFGSFKTPFTEMTDAADGMTQTWEGELTGQNDLKSNKKFYLQYDESNVVDGVDKVDHTKERTRIGSITVEYEGEPSRCLMPRVSVVDDYITNEPIVLTCPEKGAKIYYALGTFKFDNTGNSTIADDEGFQEYDGSPIALSQPTDFAAYAYVEGKGKSGLYSRWYVPGPEDSNHAVFNFSDPVSLGLEAISELSVSDKEFKDNGIIFVNTTTASKKNNGPRIMSTEAYGFMWDMRHAANNNKNNNKMKFTTENPENSICSVVLMGSTVKGVFSAAVNEQVIGEDSKKTTVEYVFPDNVNYEDETAQNHTNKIFKPFTSGKAGDYVAVWKQSEDYEGEEPANKVIFDMFNTESSSNINQVHVFYYGDAPQTGGVNDIVSTEDKDAPVEFYNLQGVKVSGNEPGLYIRRQGGKAVKILVK